MFIKKYIRKVNIYTVLFLTILIFVIMLFAKNCNDYFETFAVNEVNNIPKWKYDKTTPTQKWDEWCGIKQNGFVQSCKDLGLTTPNSKMTIVFMFRCQYVFNNWRNIFHFTDGDDITGNYGKIGDRIPAMWIYPSQHVPTGGEYALHIRFGTKSSFNDGYDYTVVRPLDSQEFFSLVFDDDTFAFYMNGTLIFSAKYSPIEKRKEYTRMFIGDPWHHTEGLLIKNFTIYNGALSAKNISEVYNKIMNGPVGIEGTAANLIKLATNFHNDPKPCWVYEKTQNKYSLISLMKYPWSALNIPDNNNMAFSFWINLGDDVNSEAIRADFFYLKVLDCSCWMSIKPDKTLSYGNLQNNRFFMPIGPQDTTWITVSFRPGGQEIFLNGVLTHSSTVPVTDPNNVGSGLYLTPRKGVFIKDLMFYDHSLSEKVVGILYNGLMKK